MVSAALMSTRTNQPDHAVVADILEDAERRRVLVRDAIRAYDQRVRAQERAAGMAAPTCETYETDVNWREWNPIGRMGASRGAPSHPEGCQCARCMFGSPPTEAT